MTKNPLSFSNRFLPPNFGRVLGLVRKGGTRGWMVDMGGRFLGGRVVSSGFMVIRVLSVARSSLSNPNLEYH